LHHTLTGHFQHHKSFRSRFLKSARDIIVYLPPEYHSAPETRYPVLYMNDGQNLFDAATAFLGNEWGLDETAEGLIRAGEIQPIIIVGIYNAGFERIAEYTHVKDRRGRGGRARAYGKLVVGELKPLIDREYRTLADAANTGIGGSSLGGLVSLYFGLQHPEVFGKLLVMSPSVWWANATILKEVSKIRHKIRQKIWLDVGTQEDAARPEIFVAQVRALRDALLEKGWVAGEELAYTEDEGAGHNEGAWGQRAAGALKFLFPPTLT
jgi:predicted alpha/beta superfamily hydrolase